MFNFWLDNMLEVLKNTGGGKGGIEILEQCGRQCARSGFMKEINMFKESTKHIKNDEELLDNLSRVWGKIHKENGNIYVVYEQCYCPVKKEAQVKNPFFCNCSKGWVKEIFETVFEKSVDVDLEESIVKGNDKCKFKVSLGVTK